MTDNRKQSSLADLKSKISLLSPMLMFAVLLLVTSGVAFLVYQGFSSNELRKKESLGRHYDLEKLRAFEQKFLHEVAWADEKKVAVKITIDQAIKKVAKRYQP